MSLARLLSLDAALSQKIQDAGKPAAWRRLAAVLAHSGDSWFWLLGLAVVWLLGDGFWKRWAVVLGAGIVLTAILVLAIKFAVRRQRPSGEWGEIYRKTDPHSFPSGHAARAVMLALLGSGLGPGWVAAPLFAWAPLVGLARVALGVHYLLDVLAGMVIGGVMGAALLWGYAFWG